MKVEVFHPHKRKLVNDALSKIVIGCLLQVVGEYLNAAGADCSNESEESEDDSCVSSLVLRKAIPPADDGFSVFSDQLTDYQTVVTAARRASSEDYEDDSEQELGDEEEDDTETLSGGSESGVDDEEEFALDDDECSEGLGDDEEEEDELVRAQSQSKGSVAKIRPSS